MSIDKLNYILQWADNALILGHRISEWTGHGPILEQDIALTNMALDHLGQARALYQYAAEIYNDLPIDQKETVFMSPLLQQSGPVATEDSLAYLRDGWDFKNLLLVERPNGHWGHTIARSFLYDGFAYLLFKALLDSKDDRLAAIAEKSLKEATYHRKWSSEWMIRLGDGTSESHNKMQEAIDDCWPFTEEMFQSTTADKAMLAEGIGPDIQALKREWDRWVDEVLAEATLERPSGETWMQTGGKEGKHSEHLGYVLAELQYMQRAYPGLEW